MQVVWYIAAAATVLIFSVLAFFAGIFYRKKVAESKFGSAEIEAENIVEDARRTAEARSKEMLLDKRGEHQNKK